MSILGKDGEFYESPTSNESTFKFCETPKYIKPNAGRSKSSRKFDHVNSSHEEIDLKESVPHVHQHEKHEKRHSILTESTFSESEVSGATTTARCDSITGSNSSEKTNEVDTNYRSRVRSRRHAINITSNPGYQVGEINRNKTKFTTRIKINIKYKIMSLILC